MDEDLKILVGLDIDTKIKDINSIQNKINKENDLKLKIKVEIDNNQNTVESLKNDIGKLVKQIETTAIPINLKFNVNKTILQGNISSKISKSIESELKTHPVTITIANAEASLDNISMKKLEELQKLSDIKIKLDKIEGIDEVKAQISELSTYIDNSLGKKSIKISEGYKPSNEDLRRIQSYLDAINKIDSKNRNVSKISFISPDQEEFKTFDYVGVSTNLDEFYNDLGKRFGKINDLTKISATKFSDYIKEFTRYLTLGGTRSFDGFFKNGITMIDFLNEAQNKLGTASKPVISNGKVDSSATVENIQRLKNVIDELNRSMEITPEKVSTFVESINKIVDINEEKINNLSNIVSKIQNIRKELSSKITVNKSEGTLKVENEDNNSSQKAENVNEEEILKSISKKDEVNKIRSDIIKIYTRIKQLKEDLSKMDITTPFLDKLANNFSQTALAIDASVESIITRIDSLINKLQSSVDASLLDTIKSSINEINNNTNALSNNPSNNNTSTTNSGSSTNGRKKTGSRSSNTINSLGFKNTDVKSIIKDISKLDGILSSIGKTGDTEFDALVTDIDHLKNSFSSFIASISGTKDPVSKQIQIYTDFRTELEKVTQSVQRYQKQYEVMQTAITKANASSAGKKQRQINNNVFDTNNTLYTVDETKDLDKIRTKLEGLLGLNNLAIKPIKFDALDEIQKLNVFVDQGTDKIEKLSFEIKTIGSNGAKGLVYVGKTITTIGDEADNAVKKLDQLMMEAANKNKLSIDDTGKLSGSNDAQYKDVNEAYVSALKRINDELNNPNATFDSFLKVIEKETASLKEQIKILGNRDSVITKTQNKLDSLNNYVNSHSLGERGSALSQELEYLNSLDGEDLTLFDNAQLEKTYQELEKIYKRFKEIEALSKNDNFIANRDSFITSSKADLEGILERSPKIKNNSDLYGQWKTIYDRLNENFLVDNGAITRVKKEISALKAEFKLLGVTESSVFEKMKANASKFAQWFGMSQVIMSAVNAMKQMITVSIELDTQLTNLQIASGYTAEKTKTLLRSYSQLAQELGGTTTEVSSAADSWLRQGYSIQETNDLIKNSMILSKVGQLDSAEATQYLTSAMKGYNIEASNSLSIVDKLSAVDMKAAVSAGGLAEAMSRTASGAQLAGIEMDKLIGYATVIGETTQKSMDTVGESLKSIFARMGQIKAGRLEDPETGEDLSNVETSLGNAGIDLRESNNEFRNFGEVLDEIGGKWDTYNSVQQRAIANSIAGIHQYENFVVLMENYGKALEYATISAESNGTATQKFSIYQESAAAKINKTKAAYEDLSYTIVNTDAIKNFFDTLTSVLNVSKNIVDTLGLIPVIMAGIGTYASISGKNAGKLSMPSYWENNYIQLIGCRKGA